jgi:hypothetical protein
MSHVEAYSGREDHIGIGTPPRVAEPLLTTEQLQLEITEARSGADGQPQTSEQLIEHIIALYAAEFDKANDEIARLRGELSAAARYLRKYQARYHGAEHAQKRWQAVDAWLKENQP